ncbi:arabinogalactan endo-1,4-beta-galactosidase [Pseudaeromonas sp. ZJS20]|uniref:glycoside hydrolase family 53 protein n=1 Tax=Pseudaeromonas aegiceratis TaxID=3153928 RepID=UPI00390C9B94
MSILAEFTHGWRRQALVLLLAVGPLAVAQAAPIIGADVSHLPQLEAAGAQFYDQDAEAPEDLLRILKRNGFNRIRLKVWNEPGKYPVFPSDQSGPEGYNNPAHVVAMAKRAQAAGLQVMIDFHYSDWWADPGKQSLPVAWRNLDAAQVSERLYAFTYAVMSQLKDAGVTPAEVQVGNEISNGMLWPLGRVPQWDNLARFIQAGARAVKAVSPSSRVVLHLDAGADNARCRRWFDAMVARGVPFDVIGLSFYPVWHGALAELQQNMDDLSRRYDKPVMVVETAYPWTRDNGDSQKNIYTSTGPETFPMTPAGQQAFLRALWQTVKRVPEGRGAGVIYWEPDFIPQAGAGWKVGAGDEWDNVTLFDFAGRALPGLKTFAEAAQ